MIRWRGQTSSATHSDGGIESITVPGTVLGPFPEPNVGQQWVTLYRGDSVVFYTGGVLEAAAPAVSSAGNDCWTSCPPLGR